MTFLKGMIATLSLYTGRRDNVWRDMYYVCRLPVSERVAIIVSQTKLATLGAARQHACNIGDSWANQELPIWAATHSDRCSPPLHCWNVVTRISRHYRTMACSSHRTSARSLRTQQRDRRQTSSSSTSPKRVANPSRPTVTSTATTGAAAECAAVSLAILSPGRSNHLRGTARVSTCLLRSSSPRACLPTPQRRSASCATHSPGLSASKPTHEPMSTRGTSSELMCRPPCITRLLTVTMAHTDRIATKSTFLMALDHWSRPILSSGTYFAPLVMPPHQEYSPRAGAPQARSTSSYRSTRAP